MNRQEKKPDSLWYIEFGAPSLALLVWGLFASATLVKDGLIPLSAGVFFDIFTVSAFGGLFLLFPSALFLRVSRGYLERLETKRWPYLLLLGWVFWSYSACISMVLAGFPVRKNISGFLNGMALSLVLSVALVFLVRRRARPVHGVKLLFLASAILGYGMHSLLTRNIFFVLHTIFALYLYLSLLGFFYLWVRQNSSSRSLLFAPGAIIVLAALFPLRWSSFYCRNVMVYGSSLARHATEPAVLVFGSYNKAPLEALGARAEPAPKERFSPFSSGKGRELLPQIAAQKPKSLLLLTVDAIRPDAFLDPSMKTFSRLVSEGVLVPHITTAAPSTFDSFKGMFLGVYSHRISLATHPLARVFRDAGFEAIAVPGSVNLYKTNNTWMKDGFTIDSTTEEFATIASAKQRNERLFFHRKELGEKRFFLWTHYNEPHLPHQSPGPDQTTQYRGDVRLADTAIGNLLKEMDDLGLLDGVLVVITGDHGEELSEHGGISHSRTLFSEVTQVPLLFWMKGGQAKGLVDIPMSGVDLGPTLLYLFGIARPEGFAPDGVSLFDAEVERPEISVRGAFSRQTPYPALSAAAEASVGWGQSWRLIVNLEYGDASLFDREKDPLEQHNVIEEEPEVAAALAQKLLPLFAGSSVVGSSGE